MAEENNNIKELEKKWQEFWEKHPEFYKASDVSSREKKYVLVEFPYPSGSGLHVGHAFTFTGGDVYARYWRMKGYNVLFPMGWDAFGLPTENYAIKTKRKPQDVTVENTDMFKRQMKHLAFSFDWSREVNTTDPEYYKWTQWIFIQLYKKGLAYKQEMPINWCPECKIGLANEEVVNGKCERCGAEVERRTISQWVVKITDYADRLAEGLKDTDFIEKVKAAQINWIGKSEGARIKFNIKGRNEELEVFTTRPDTLYGATFMVIAPEHKLVDQLVRMGGERTDEIKAYVKQARSKSDLERTELQKEKTGVFSGLHAINPVTEKEIPVWISDFVLASYGTGAIMSVPAHDERDWDFAKKFELPIVPVIDTGDNWNYDAGAKTEVDKGKMINSEIIDGYVPREAITKVISWLEEKGIGKRAASYHLRDWIFSRQHYWGEPIPMIYCEEHGWQPVKEDELPVRLPEVEAYEPTNTGESPLANISDWVDTVCPICGKAAKRETDTMPNWAGSDWYFLRYIDPYNDAVLANKELMEKWLPVDVYIGGDEHNTLHLLYSRFIYQFLYDIGAVPSEHSEPYYKRISHGVILGPDNQRMSKSRGNVIVPEVVADKYGVDVVRMYLMFMGPFDGTMAWNENTLMGVKRFLDKYKRNLEAVINNIKQSQSEIDSSKDIKLIVNKLIEGVSEDTENFGYNTSIAKMMEANNALVDYYTSMGREEAVVLIKLLAPYAPYLAEELWSLLRREDEPVSVHISEWPVADRQNLVEDKLTIAVAINGKVRDEIEVDSVIKDNQQEVLGLARASEKVKQWTEGKEVIKEIYVPGRMINLVVK